MVSWGRCSGPVRTLEATTCGPPRKAEGQAANSSAMHAAVLARAMPQGEAQVPVAGLQARGHDRSGGPSHGGGLGIGAAEVIRLLSGVAEA